jgi:SAM-dependent methyltransferase
MEPYEYRTLFDSETSYWWYRGIRAIILDTLERLDLGPSPCILDTGCGTGKNLESIRGKITPYSFGFDISPYAAKYWPQRGLKHMCLASINEVPFRDESFDAVLSIDVLECDEVMENQAYRELWRVTRQEGYIIVVAPAYEWLFDKEHHKAVHASRRYTKDRLKSILEQLPVRIERITYLFPSILPIISGYRLLRRFRNDSVVVPPRSDLRPLPRILNELLYHVVQGERLLLPRFNFPFGSSIMAAVQKM